MFIRSHDTGLGYKRASRSIRRALLLGLIGVFLVAGCDVALGGLERQLSSIVGPYRFSVFGWEVGTLANEIKQVFVPGERVEGNETEIVREYFSLIGEVRSLESEIDVAQSAHVGDLASLQAKLESLKERRSELEDTVEGILERQIRGVLIEERILNPLDNYLPLNSVFPPVNFEFERPPHLLVVSPRDRIELAQRYLLSQSLSDDERDGIESEADALGVSSLVVEIGGFAATYPTTVVDTPDLRSAIYTVVEEWLHQYLAFRPLGFLYILDATGLRESEDVATRNETLAGMVSQEVGARVYEKYYAEQSEADPAGDAETENDAPGFDFYEEMRETRRAVDELLDQGKVEEAEWLMELKREQFAAEGYHIRKLNQAYFAFHGIYGYHPASVSPIHAELKALRVESTSLKEFLDKAAWMSVTPAQALAMVCAVVVIPIAVGVWLRRWLVRRLGKRSEPS